MSRDPHDPIESAPGVDPQDRVDTDYSPSSERETEVLQDDSANSPALHGVDRSKVQVLPGTGDPTDEGDVEVDASDIHIPRHPDSDGVGAILAEGRPGGTDDEI